MSTPNPMPPTVNLNNDVENLDEPRIGVISPSIPDLTTQPNENDLNKQFSGKVAEIFNDVVRNYKIHSSIGEDGTDSDENLKMAVLRDLKVALKADIDDLKEKESKLQVSATEAAIAHKCLAAVFDLLDGDPDREPESVFESVVRRILTQDILQELCKIQYDDYVLFLANPPTSVSYRDLYRYRKQQACFSKILEVFDEVDYRPDHPEYLLKLMETMYEMISYGPPLDLDDFDKFEDPKCRGSWHRDTASFAQ